MLQFVRQKHHLCFHAIPDLACLPSYNSNTVLCHFLLDNATVGTFCTKMNKRNVFACHSAFRKKGPKSVGEHFAEVMISIVQTPKV